MPRKKVEPKSPGRSRAIATRQRDARGRVLPKSEEEHLQEEDISVKQTEQSTCLICCQPRPCLADRERERLEGQRVTDTSDGLICVISKVGHLKDNPDVFAQAKGHNRLVLTSRLR
jgi:hypothetical protein